MTLSEVVLKLTYESPFIEFSRRFPFIKIFFWCTQENDVMEILVSNQQQYSLMLNHIPRIYGTNYVSSDGQSFYLIMHKCYCMTYNSVVKLIGTLGLLHIFPGVVEKGWEYRRIVAFKHKDFEKFLQRLEKEGMTFEILRKAPIKNFNADSSILTADALFSDLTNKQIDAILRAHKHGYYKMPREAGVLSIAAKEKVPRATYHEHLKKGENRILTALIPYIQLFRQTPLEIRKDLRIDKIRARP